MNELFVFTKKIHYLICHFADTTILIKKNISITYVKMS